MNPLAQAARWKLIWTALLVIVGVVSFYCAYLGIRTLEPFWTSVGFAVAITAFHVVAWASLYAMVPNVVSGRAPKGRGFFVTALVVVACPAIIATNTFLSWANVAAGPSLRRHYQESINESDNALAELRAGRERELELKTVLAQTSAAILRLAQDEEGHGALTTKDRKGPFSLALYELSSAYSDATEILARDNVEAQESFAEAERVLSTMRDLLAEATEHHERLDEINTRFGQAAFRMNRLLADLKRSPLRSVLTVVRKSDATIEFLPARRDVPQETAAKAALIKLATDSKSRIDRLADGADRSSLVLPRFEAMSRHEASFAYVKSFVEYPIMCLTIDLLVPLAGLIVLVFFAPGRASDQPVASRSEKGGPSDEDTATHPSADGAERIVQALRRAHQPGLASSGATNGARVPSTTGRTS